MTRDACRVLQVLTMSAQSGRVRVLLHHLEMSGPLWQVLTPYSAAGRLFYRRKESEREREMCFYVLLKPLETLTSPDRDQASNVLYHISYISPATHGTFL